MKRYKSLTWILKLQARTSPIFMAWKTVGTVYEGLSTVVGAFLAAKVLSSVGASVFTDAPTRDIIFWLIMTLVFSIIDRIYSDLDRLWSGRFRMKMDRALSSMLFRKVYQLNQEQFEDEKFNIRFSRAQDSLVNIQYLFYDLFGSISIVIRLVTSLVAVAFVAPWFTIVLLGAALPLTLIGLKQNKLEEHMERNDATNSRIYYRTRWLLIDPAQMVEIRLVNGFQAMVKHWRKSFKRGQDRIYAFRKKIFAVESIGAGISPLVEFIGNLYLLRLVIEKLISFDSFIFVRGLVGNATSSVSSLSSYITRVHRTLVEFQNFQFVIDTEPTIPDGTVKVNAPLSIEFRNVDFKYPSSEEYVLRDISFIITPGSRLALVGENGAGKSTLIKLLMRQYLPTSGQILVNGEDIQNIEQEAYYREISTLSQNFLMVSHFTLRDNLELGLSKTPSDQDIAQVCEMSGASSFIDKLKRGLNTRPDSSFKDGSSLSGGQMQRIGVARALLRGADVLLLDEPTSAMDAKAEYKLFNNIYEAHSTKTTFIISHRFSTVRKADKIIVLGGGRIIEYGSHEDLLEHGGLYKEMFEVQAEGYK